MAIRTGSHPQHLAEPLRNAGDLDPLLERIGEARVVCIGEASHGTHDYYTWRALLTQRLIVEKDFGLVAVEGDWPDCHAVNRSITGAASASADPRDALVAFARWPTWMWANQEVVVFTRWLREHNLSSSAKPAVGFYGLDVYSLWDSLRVVLDYLREHHPEHLDSAMQAWRCFEPYAEDPQAYARATRLVPQDCELEVITLLSKLLDRATTGTRDSEDPRGDAAFDAEQNAYAAAGAEAYYRAMVRGGAQSWNVRDIHMADTLDRLLEHHREKAATDPKAVVWEHNTHVGDARFTDMADAGMVNVGQLVRERYGEAECVLVGFGSYQGTVVAADEWGRPMRTMVVPPARSDSTEALLHDTLPDGSALFVFPPDLPGWAADERAHRAIGVVYRPGAERWGNYVPTVLGKRYDAFLWLDETTAVHPLHGVQPHGAELETWPFGG